MTTVSDQPPWNEPQPPADVQATPDPRLDVVVEVLRTDDAHDDRTCAQRILGALDAMQPEERRSCGGGCVLAVGHAYECEMREVPAPAGLTPQEIRRWIEFGADIATKAIHIAAMVEHDDDEAPDSEARAGLLRLAEQRNVAVIRANEAEKRLAELDETPALLDPMLQRHLEQAEARADLAEARLGHIADALKDYDDPLSDEPFVAAVRDSLAWTPDDTATVSSVCPSTGEVGGHDKAGCSCWDDTATAGADTTGDGDG